MAHDSPFLFPNESKKFYGGMAITCITHLGKAAILVR